VTVEVSPTTMLELMSSTAATKVPMGTPAVPIEGCSRYAIFAADESTMKSSNLRGLEPPPLAVRNPAYMTEAVPIVVRPLTV
jgi:hypothetical protein